MQKTVGGCPGYPYVLPSEREAKNRKGEKGKDIPIDAEFQRTAGEVRKALPQ